MWRVRRVRVAVVPIEERADILTRGQMNYQRSFCQPPAKPTPGGCVYSTAASAQAIAAAASARVISAAASALAIDSNP